MRTAISPERDRPATASAASGSGSSRRFRGASRRSAWSSLEPRLVLVHLGVLAVAAVALDELALARDLLCRRVRVLARPASRSSRWRRYAL